MVEKNSLQILGLLVNFLRNCLGSLLQKLSADALMYYMGGFFVPKF